MTGGQQRPEVFRCLLKADVSAEPATRESHNWTNCETDRVRNSQINCSNRAESGNSQHFVLPDNESEVAEPAAGPGLDAEDEIGLLPPRSLAAEANDCFMVWIPRGSAE